MSVAKEGGHDEFQERPCRWPAERGKRLAGGFAETANGVRAVTGADSPVRRDMRVVRILVAVDGSPLSWRVVSCAAAVAQSGARAMEAPPALHLVHVIAPPSGFVDVPTTAVEVQRRIENDDAAALAMVEENRNVAVAAGALVADVSVVRGDPADEIVRIADELDADVVVVGANAKGFLRRAVLGSVSGSVLRAAHRPVLVVPAMSEDD